MDGRIVILLGTLVSIPLSESVWQCTTNADCDSLSGSVCDATGACRCAPGQQPVLGGSACVDVAPYHTSPCVEDHQCSRLFTAFECRRYNETSLEGNCFCSPSHHYFRGRCWRTADFGAACTRDEECLGTIRNPFSMRCSGTCQCAEGFYERQRGDCRQIGEEAGAGCILDIDCQFPGGVCDLSTLKCIYSETAPSLPPEQPSTQVAPLTQPLTTIQRVACDHTTPCGTPFECSPSGVCICPVGYYESTDGQRCLAELGSPAEAGQCVGLLAVIINGTCSCPANMFFEENMRDCVRATRRITDSCVADNNCHTFGPAARCGAPQEPFQFRSCECVPEYAVWDERQTYCRLFSGVGGSCEVDSDCQAGDLEIHCVKNEEGQGVCSCPDGLEEFEGLCLSTGLGLGDRCQHSRECTAIENIACDSTTQLCECTDGYQENDGACSPIIGGSCSQDSDCVIPNTECRNGSTGSTCECTDAFITYQDACWPRVLGFDSTCNVTAQCEAAMGSAGVCDNGHCSCIEGHHFRDENCWPVTRLLESCSSISQCYLPGASDRVVCRNALCQCDFHYPYSEELQTCLAGSGASSAAASVSLLLTATVTLLKISR